MNTELLGGDEKLKDKTLSLLLVAMMVTLAFVGLAVSARAADYYTNNQTRIYLNSNNYPGGIPGNWFYPGDTITGYLEGRPIGGGIPPVDGFEDTLDVVVADDDPLTGGCDPVVRADIRMQVDNVVIEPPPAGTGVFSFPGSATQYLSDGYYCAWAAPGDYLEGVSANPYPNRNRQFEIHMYQVTSSTDKGGYIPGDTVKIFYTVSSIRDGSLITDTAFTGEWLVQSTDGLTFWNGNLPAPTGQFSYTILNSGGTNLDIPPVTYPTYIWYNGTSMGAKRTFQEFVTVPVGNLGATIAIDTPFPVAFWAPGSVLPYRVQVYVTPNTAWRYPNASVEVTILNGATPTSPPISGYQWTFRSDANGQVKHMFLLDPAIFLKGKTYTISANATSILKTALPARVTFSVQTVLQTMAVEMSFDKESYYSDETVVVTVAAQPPSGHSQPSTYIYYVTSSSAVFARQSSSSPTYSFRTPANFQGTLSFGVDVYNTEGDYGFDAEDKDVWYGIMIVNVDPPNYKAGDTVKASFELRTTVMTSGSLFYYKVCADGCAAGGSVVSEGSVAATDLKGSFTYTVPNAPAASYGFQVSATEAGRIVKAEATANLVRGYILSITFDKESYKPGDAMKVTYTITSRSAGSPLPRVFYLSYGLVNYPTVLTMTTEPSGTVTYTIPEGANEGDVLFGMSDSATGADAVEVVFIGSPAEPIRLFDAFLLVLIVILFLLVLALRGRGAGTGAAAKPKEEKAAPPPPPGQQVSPMIVNCKSCGAPIEITTSKRPIEVMCPSCGETAMVQ